MKYGYAERRFITMSDIRKMCIRENWYTLGDNEDYDKLLKYARREEITTDNIVEMAQLIKNYSETKEELTSIMYEIGRNCTTVFSKSN